MEKLLLIAIVVATGCATNGSSGGFEIDGAVTGAGAPSSGHVIVLWDLVDTGYKWGDGTATATTFTVTFDQDPPAGAILAPAGIAVGYPVLVADGTVVPDGPVTSLANIATLGMPADYAVIWKSPTAAGLGTWDATFGARYSCGRCVHATTGGHDSFELTACAAVTIVFGGATVCNWS